MAVNGVRLLVFGAAPRADMLVAWTGSTLDTDDDIVLV
jgi:hypothetical protein